MTKLPFLNIFAGICLVLGVVIAAPLVIGMIETSKALNTPINPVNIEDTSNSNKTPTPVKKAVREGIPQTISIPSLGISLGVKKGDYTYETGAWDIDDWHAFYATLTKPVNDDSGNTLIYGHNSYNIFGTLPNIKPGAIVKVKTSNKLEFTYKFSYHEAVKPTDVYALEYHGSPRLTLQTCSGLWNETREMYYFSLKSVRKL